MQATKFRLSICCSWLLFCVVSYLSVIGQASAKESYTWSVVPQFPGLVIHSDWTPVLDYLNENTPYHFKLVIHKNIPEFEKAFTRGEPDIAYMNPYHAVMARQAQGYRPIIRDSKRELTGILVVKKDSPYQSVKDLSGSTIAFPSPNAFAAALYMRALLHEKEKIEFTPHYAETHSNAYRMVLLGRSAAAGGVTRTLEKERPEVEKNLRVIYQTPSTPSHPVAAHQRVPDEVISSLQNAFAKMAADETHREKLKTILLPIPIPADYERDYRFLEELQLGKYVVNRTANEK